MSPRTKRLLFGGSCPPSCPGGVGTEPCVHAFGIAHPIGAVLAVAVILWSQS